MKNAVRRASGALALAVIVVASLLSVMTAHAADTSDDCFGGALSQDPLHCYVLEQAHNEGIIEVDAVYWGGRVLYLFLTEEDYLMDGSEEYAYFRSKAQEEARRTGEDQCVLDPPGCSYGVFPIGEHGYILPESHRYDDIWLVPGGKGALRSQWAWASFYQWWPSVTESGTEKRAVRRQTRSSAGFDVSDVDLANLSPVDCSNLIAQTEACNRWKSFPSLGIAGWHTQGNRLYVQVKPPYDEEYNISVVRTILSAEIPGGLKEDNLVIIPVKYNYRDLWQYSELLNRFAYSSANTVGIVGASIGNNRTNYKGRMYRTAEFKEVAAGAEGYRETVHLFSNDHVRTRFELLHLLPQLLPQLGIPVDAVGLVVQHSVRPEVARQSARPQSRPIHHPLELMPPFIGGGDLLVRVRTLLQVRWDLEAGPKGGRTFTRG